jgi:hypothetical protein
VPIQKMGIRASCDGCGEIMVAASEKDLGERAGWLIVQSKGKQAFCGMTCQQTWLDEKLSPTQTSLDDVLHGAEMHGRAVLPDDPKPEPAPEQPAQADESEESTPGIPNAFRDALDGPEGEGNEPPSPA